MKFESPQLFRRTSPSRLVLQDNGGLGLRAQLSKVQSVEVNPKWLDFSHFSTLNLSMGDQPAGPSNAGPQLWRSTFTVGAGSNWRLSNHLVWHAGYRFFNNPMPEEIVAGALPNASQHVVATGFSYHQGAHTITLAYGLDLFDPAGNFDAYAQHANVQASTTAHLVSMIYRLSF